MGRGIPMRVFVALPLPPATATALADALQPLRAAHTDIRWVNPDGFHITLHFFGDVSETQLADLKAALLDSRLAVPSIAARLGALGQFPPRGNPRVVWVSLSLGGEEARVLWERVEQVVEPLGWQQDPRGFTPHVTVGRAGRGGTGGLDPAGLPILEAAFRFEEIVLFESVLGKGGAIYRPEARAALARGNA
jgi:2'-5' RNA ligase